MSKEKGRKQIKITLDFVVVYNSLSIQNISRMVYVKRKRQREKTTTKNTKLHFVGYNSIFIRDISRMVYVRQSAAAAAFSAWLHREARRQNIFPHRMHSDKYTQTKKTKTDKEIHLISKGSQKTKKNSTQDALRSD